MPSAESDLAIVSLVRYADSCDPAHRHNDCPFAVVRQGKLTCHEECRGVIRSLLRRGRGEPASKAQSFDARQLRLSEPPGAPDILWRTSSLLQLVMEAARTSPLRPDGSLELRRLVEATSALGALGSRGLDPEKIIRRGLAAAVKLALAAGLGLASKDRLKNWKYLTQWRAIFEGGRTGNTALVDYISAVFDGPVSRRLDAWIETSSIEDVLTWKPPSSDAELLAADFDVEDVEAWTWLVDRFTQTYLDRWSTSSLKCEYRFVQGAWDPGISTEVLAERAVAHEEIATALADRSIASDDLIDPATLASFTDQALSLLDEGQRTAAAALFNAARMLKPKDLRAQNNYAFCVLIDKPEEARALLLDVVERGEARVSTVALCNLALAESLLGETDAALGFCERAYRDESQAKAYLWTRRQNEWIVERIIPRTWAVRLGVELERTVRSDGGVWVKRLEGISPLGRAASSDPSSAGAGEEGQ